MMLNVICQFNGDTRVHRYLAMYYSECVYEGVLHEISIWIRLSKVMFKILQARLQQYMNHELPEVQAGFRKDRGTRNQLLISAGSWKKQESSRKTGTISALLTTPKPLTVWITTNCGKF